MKSTQAHSSADATNLEYFLSYTFLQKDSLFAVPLMLEPPAACSETL